MKYQVSFVLEAKTNDARFYFDNPGYIEGKVRVAMAGLGWDCDRTRPFIPQQIKVEPYQPHQYEFTEGL